MEILDVKYGGNFVFNKEKTNYHPKSTQDQDGFKTATVEMKFKIKNITAKLFFIILKKIFEYLNFSACFLLLSGITE